MTAQAPISDRYHLVVRLSPTAWKDFTAVAVSQYTTEEELLKSMAPQIEKWRADGVEMAIMRTTYVRNL